MGCVGLNSGASIVVLAKAESRAWMACATRCFAVIFGGTAWVRLGAVGRQKPARGKSPNGVPSGTSILQDVPMAQRVYCGSNCSSCAWIARSTSGTRSAWWASCPASISR